MTKFVKVEDLRLGDIAVILNNECKVVWARDMGLEVELHVKCLGWHRVRKMVRGTLVQVK